jgi:hypothetical protein
MLEPSLDGANSFSEGFAAVRKEGGFFFIDANGKQSGPLFDDECKSFTSGMALCQLNGVWLIVDNKFNAKSTLPEFDWVSLSAKDGLIMVSKKGNNGYGYADLQGQIVLEPEFDEALAFNEGCAAVRKGTSWAFVGARQMKVKIITNFQFDNIQIFKEGLAVCKLKTAYHFINAEGNILTERFSNAQYFQNGLAPVQEYRK